METNAAPERRRATVVSLSMLDGPSSPPVSQPVLEISLGSSSADEWSDSIVSVVVRAGVAPTVDFARLRVAAVEGAATAALDDTGSVALGYEETSSDTVFTGGVATTQHEMAGTTMIEVANGGRALARLRVSQSYEQQSAGAVVTDLAGLAGVGTDLIEDGIELPFYVVDNRRNALEHIAALAERNGFIAYLTPDDLLYFGPWKEGEPVGTFTYGEDILALSVTEAAPSLGSIAVVGEGAAGAEGKEAWCWIAKDPAAVTGSAGDGEPEGLLSDAALRSSDAAQAVADAGVAGAALRAISGRILVPGSATVTVGQAIEIADTPEEALAGSCLVRSVVHRYAQQSGFTTAIDFWKTGAGGGGLGGLL